MPAGNALSANAVSSRAGIWSIVFPVAWDEAAGTPPTPAAAHHRKAVTAVSCLFAIRLTSPAILTRRRRTGKSRTWSLSSDKRHRDVDDVGLLPISRQSGDTSPDGRRR